MKDTLRASLIFWLFFLVLLLMTTMTYGQRVQLEYKNIPLNEVLIDLNERFETQISINSQLSTNCDVSLSGKFNSIEHVLEMLAQQCDLKLHKLSGIYIFQQAAVAPPDHLTASVEPETKLRSYLFQGQVIEEGSGEPLPFANIQLAGKGFVTDESGRFSFKSFNKREHVQLSSLGYFQTDTVLADGGSITLVLQPKIVELEAVEVAVLDESARIHVGKNAGKVAFNNIGSSFVPGISNNIIFNNLRLYPGIMAAGESIADYIIWGSYAGQNHVIYDGITLFNSWGIHADIGRINPFMIQHVALYKGGYNVPYGDRIGGVVMIDGKRGHQTQAEGNVSLTNQLANIYLNIPMFNNTSSLQIAGRKSYFNVFGQQNDFDDRENVVVPTYDYADFNIKFSTTFNNGDRLEISSINSNDSFEGEVKVRRPRRVENISVTSQQFGNSIQYAKNWKSGGLTSLQLTQSYYSPQLTTNFIFRERDETGAVSATLKTDVWENPVEEYVGRISHQFPIKNMHQVSVSGAYIQNYTSFRSDFTNNLLENAPNKLERLSFYALDHITFHPQFSIELGLKADMPLQKQEIFWQPRINAHLALTPFWHVNMGWGKYNQFIARNAVVDELGNRYDIWNVANEQFIPVLSATHTVLSTSFIKKGFELTLEGYLKNTDAVSRFLLNVQPGKREALLLQGEAKVKGLDIFLKKKVLAHEFWLSYTLSEVMERFDRGRRTTPYREAPQSQLHEIKAASVFNFSQLQFSLSQVYGSGFPNTTIQARKKPPKPYWRTDLAMQYLFNVEQLHFQAGFSLLNIFDQENVRLNQSVNVPNEGVINTLGIPFTPTVFLDCRF